jgi:anthranilate/para-aminobenzoate synthase component I
MEVEKYSHVMHLVTNVQDTRYGDYCRV